MSELLRILVDYSNSEAYLFDYSTDLSKGGIFVKTDRPLPVGTKVQLKFTFPDSIELFETTGEVMWINDPKKYPKNQEKNDLVGMGVRFINLAARNKKLIEDFIKKQLQ